MTDLLPLERDGTLTVWRITRAEYASTALSGMGGLYAAGRWHQQGHEIVYLASSWSLAALEVLVHLGRNDALIPFIYLQVSIPAAVSAQHLLLSRLPKNWHNNPPGLQTRQLGSQWLAANTSALLKVPSVISPAEYNWLFNPKHSDAELITVSQPRPFYFDQQFWDT